MTTNKPLRLAVTMLAVVSWTLPGHVLGGQPGVEPSGPLPVDASRHVTPEDVSLSENGQLNGTAVDEQGTPISGVSVYLLREDGAMAGQTQTDRQGRFTFHVSRGGVYQVIADGRATLLRCWVSNTAPPEAHSSVLVSVGPVERGQIHPAVSSFSNPWIITGIVIAAIAIPVALHNNRSDRESASE